MIRSHAQLASVRLAPLSLVLAGALGCTGEVVIGTVEGTGGDPGTATGTNAGTTTTTTTTDLTTTTSIVCGNAPVSCTFGGGGCDCTGSCPQHTLEARCTSTPGGAAQCACFDDDNAVGSCSPSPSSNPYLGACDLGAGCCVAFFTIGGG